MLFVYSYSLVGKKTKTALNPRQYDFFFLIAMFVCDFKSRIHFCLKLHSDLKLTVSKANWKSCLNYIFPPVSKNLQSLLAFKVHEA